MEEGVLRRHTDDFVFVFSAMIFVASVYLLLDESLLFKFQRRNVTDLQIVASMSQRTSDVRRRIATDIAWFPVATSDSLFLGDSLFTGPQSQATVSFKDGADLTLDEETLISLEKSTEKTILNLKSGSLTSRIQKGRPLTIKVGNKIQTIESDGAEIQINRNKDGAVELSVQKGKVEVATAPAPSVAVTTPPTSAFAPPAPAVPAAPVTKQILEAGQAIRSTVNQKAPAKVVEYKIDLVAPKDNQVIWKDPKTLINFEWKQPDAAGNYKIQIATDRAFKHVVYTHVVPTNSHTITDLPVRGQMFWRVINEKSKSLSAPGRFNIYTDQPPAPLAPTNNQELHFEMDYVQGKTPTNQDQFPIWLKWGYKGRSNRFAVEIAKDDKFTEIVKTAESDGWQKDVDLPEGHYFWRVKVLDPEQHETLWSRPNKMTVMRNLPAPKIRLHKQVIKMDDESSFKPRPPAWMNLLLSFFISTAEAADSAKPTVTLSWDPVPATTAYQIEIAKDEEMKHIILTEQVKKPVFHWFEKTPGTYYWRVSTVNGVGVVQEPSEVAKISLKVNSPKLPTPKKEITAMLKEHDELQSVEVEWKPIPRINSYLVETSETRDFKISTKIVVKNENHIKLQSAKNFYWRVSPLDEKGEIIGDNAMAAVKIDYKLPNLLGLYPIMLRGRYTVPLYFEPRANGIDVLPPKIDYEMKDFGLLFGRKHISPAGLELQTIQVKDRKPKLQFLIPAELIGQGLLEIEGDQKRILYSKSFDPQKEGFKFDRPGTIAFEGPSLDEDDIKKYQSHESLRLCLRQRISTSMLSLCSGAFTVNRDNTDVTFKALATEASEAKVAVNGNSLPLVGSLEASHAEQIFAAEFPDHSSVEIQTSQDAFDVEEVMLDDDESLIISGSGDKPLGVQQERGAAGEDGKWRFKIPPKQPSILLGAEGGFIWHQDLVVNKKPIYERDRPVLLYGSKTATYSKEVFLQGKIDKKFKVKAEKGKVTQTADTFEWQFPTAGKRGTNFVDTLTLESKGQEHVTQYHVYRAYAAELSSRFTLARINGTNWGIGEFSAGYWFDDLFNKQSYYWSLQRWGIYASTLLNLNPGILRIMGLDIKYRLNPGVNFHDGGLGLSLDFQNVNYKNIQGSMVGMGAFADFQLPRWFDKLLSRVPVLKMPKYLNARAIYYPLSTIGGISISNNYSLGLRGKIFVRPDFFVELGGELKELHIQQTISQFFDSSFVYGTGGFGWSF